MSRTPNSDSKVYILGVRRRSGPSYAVASYAVARYGVARLLLFILLYTPRPFYRPYRIEVSKSLIIFLYSNIRSRIDGIVGSDIIGYRPPTSPSPSNRRVEDSEVYYYSSEKIYPPDKILII